MRMINRGSASIPLADFGVEGRLEPGAIAELPDGYCMPRLQLNGSRQPSIVEELRPQLQPADPRDAAEVMKTPTSIYCEPPSLVQVGEDLARQGRPPAVVALLAQGQAEARAAASRRPVANPPAPPPEPPAVPVAPPVAPVAVPPPLEPPAARAMPPAMSAPPVPPVPPAAPSPGVPGVSGHPGGPIVRRRGGYPGSKRTG